MDRFIAAWVLWAAASLAADRSPVLPVLSRQELAPRIVECSAQSRALGRRERFVVVLPEGYREDGRPWPVVYFLHGAGRHCRSMVDSPRTRAAWLGAGFVSVHPNGRGGWWIDSPVRPQSRYQSWVAEGVRCAEGGFNVERRPAKRGLGGWSMGGYGAALYAEAHPGEFAALAALIPLVDFPNPSLPRDQNHSIPAVLGRDAAVWPRFNPIANADKLRGAAVWHVTGAAAFERTMNERFDRELTRLGIAHTFLTRPGGHTWDFVESVLPDALAFLEKELSR